MTKIHNTITTELETQSVFLPLFAIFCIVLVFVQGISNYYLIADESYVNFIYALNFYNGEGLQLGPAHRFMNEFSLAWSLLLSLGISCGVAPELFSVIVNIISSVAILLALVLFSAQKYGFRSLWIFLAPLTLVMNKSYVAWSTGGGEIMFFTMVLFFAVVFYLKERERARGMGWISSALLLFATLIRIEAVLFFIVLAIFYLIDVIFRHRNIKGYLGWVCLYAFLFVGYILLLQSFYIHVFSHIMFAQSKRKNIL